ncbi:hypothetical protein PV325_008418, partial [Microctonus aethiopoides]
KQERRGTIYDNNVVRIVAPFNLGWPTKESGRSYDRLSGTGKLIGYFTKKTLSIVVLNRKCRMYDWGHFKETHDCRSNYEGSAKSMEAATAVDDTNHKSKGVTSTLYKIKPGFKELNNTVIQYLGNCFNYCVVQNVGNSESMSAAIKIFQFIVSMTTEITTNGVDLKKILTLISTQSSEPRVIQTKVSMQA